ncbi:hypothetical protein HH303_16385 [Rhodospirillaceae bacterium KN72]|uniref:FAS1-like dehydratase domain-containing protein n=1 Tax=Pacificispira spongiicola TaxID=2729598 RepID=A0A7Y0HGW0_9PROT|nr:MaoC family dehydratase N-terminal domain-containing protein [Pacificispira spongiicola]NMM46073.1 hypothetical protein [Pacificispira spongiicola]
MSEYRDWIGRARISSEPITDRMLDHFKVTLTGLLGPGPVPCGFQWCLAPDSVEAAELGPDGHPRTGLFLPKLPLPRRMWAGGSVTTIRDLSLNDIVTRKSVITDVTFKQGRSGNLGFVTVEHSYSVDGDPRINEVQNIVYREAPAAGAAPPAPPVAEAWATVDQWKVTPTPTLLFRYSALTFNGHRIHYDFPYATQEEGYAGLVVHGPMQATWMQNMAAKLFGKAPSCFTYRGVSPLICGIPVIVEARESDRGLDLRVRKVGDDTVTMQATAEA